MRTATREPAGTSWIGVGLRTQHYATFLAREVPVLPLEVNAENYFARGGIHHQVLLAIAERHPVSLHGTGVSLASAEGLEPAHLDRLAQLIEDVHPWAVSEHLAWSRSGGVYLNDLLPLPFDDESLAIVADNLSRTQDRLGRRVLVENPASLVAFRSSTMGDMEMLARLCDGTGCGVLLDINNLYVSATNLGFNPLRALAELPVDAVGEIHLAGHGAGGRPEAALLIDSHDRPVAEPVWRLYRAAVARFGAVQTIIERDLEIPPLPELLEEVQRATRELAGVLEADRAVAT